MRLSVKRSKIRKRDRLFRVILSRLWKDWKTHLNVVLPEIVIRLHKKGFKLFLTHKSSKNSTGRPSINYKTRKLVNLDVILEMIEDNQGVAFLPDLIVKHLEADKHLCTIQVEEESLFFETFLAIQKDEKLSFEPKKSTKCFVPMENH